MSDPRTFSYAATGAALARMLADAPHSASRKAEEALVRRTPEPDDTDLEAPDTPHQKRFDEEQEAESLDGWYRPADEDDAGASFREDW